MGGNAIEDGNRTADADGGWRFVRRGQDVRCDVKLDEAVQNSPGR